MGAGIFKSKNRIRSDPATNKDWEEKGPQVNAGVNRSGSGRWKIMPSSAEARQKFHGNFFILQYFFQFMNKPG
jgi:hypothetical protein